ncbi:MAG: hypothetical protein H7235_07290 [Bdellovibrionaceae bacterium]|nr:hypothetical protein [Pseudobdellovibrionaceae bacterium]
MQNIKHDGRWSDIKNEVKNVWGHLSVDDIEARGENILALSELIQEKYGDTQETVIEKLETLLQRFGPTTEDIKNMKNNRATPTQDNSFKI